MTQKKSTKRALISSLLILAMCFTMLAGTTFAWFTDSVTSGNNVIKSGKLDVAFEWANGKDDPAAAATTWTDASTGAIFNYDLWEPGYTEVRHIRIANKGNLALKYKLQIVADGTVTDLAKVIDVYYFDPAQQIADRAALDNETAMGTLEVALAGMDTTATGALVPEGKEGNGLKSSEVITIALKMKTDAGNEYQNLSIGSSFTIMLLATQYTFESDSFDELYDENAEYPVVALPETITATEFAARLHAANGVIDGQDVLTVALGESERSTYNNVAAQYYLGTNTSPLDTIKISNVKFTYNPDDDSAALTVGELQPFLNLNDGATFENCTFDGVTVSPWGNNNTPAKYATFTGCTFQNIAGRYGIHQNIAKNLTVTNCTFNCERGIHTNSRETESITITGCTFTGIAASKGALCLAEATEIASATLNITGNTVDTSFLRNLSTNNGATPAQLDAIANNNTYGSLYVY